MSGNPAGRDAHPGRDTVAGTDYTHDTPSGHCCSSSCSAAPAGAASPRVDRRRGRPGSTAVPGHSEGRRDPARRDRARAPRPAACLAVTRRRRHRTARGGRAPSRPSLRRKPVAQAATDERAALDGLTRQRRARRRSGRRERRGEGRLSQRAQLTQDRRVRRGPPTQLAAQLGAVSPAAPGRPRSPAAGPLTSPLSRVHHSRVRRLRLRV